MNDLWSRSSLAIAPLHRKSQCCKSACQISTAGLYLWHAGMRLPGLSVIVAPRSVLGGGLPLMSTLPCRCYARHTRSLHGGTWKEMPASFVVTFCQRGPCVSVAELDYCWSLSQRAYRHQWRNANQYIVFADAALQRVSTHRYAVSV